ncbi:efflux RND transporter periplasmic adaptor subunit [Clostridium sp. P21]|uniref:Efflux RND transporter periplasmic adaptor subunit n=1 Tax=Clostridium muellerianum TaxID=2716538 RepID=A0A7Y0HR54_9CLOT|nr:efflux RND transporter periplasmic adaptor subunit [Clostridium muellerianum]NMM65775.1 efflux RND transporter periplasmic adaptor subunit [Clostridium muellerianum]
MKFKGIKFNAAKLKSLLKKRNIIILVVLIVVVAIGSRFLGKGNKKVEIKQNVKNVKTEKIKVSSISSDVQYASALKPTKQVEVLPKSSGKVASVNVNVGDKVTAGQTLFTLDTSELRATLQQQQAMVDSANAKFQQTGGSNYQKQLASYEQDLKGKQIKYNAAQRDYENYQKLYNAGAASKNDFDQKADVYHTADTDLQTAQQNLNLFENQIGTEDTRVAAAAVTQAQAGVSTAQIQINNATVTAPISGVVSVKNVEVGQIAGGQSGSVTIIDSSSLNAEINVPDKIVEKIQVGQSVPVIITALDDKKLTGTIDNISPNTNSKDNSYTVKVKIDNASGELKAGMFTKVSLQAENKSNVLIVPNQAVKVENGVNYIYEVKNGKIKKTAVTTGISNDKSIEVLGNVKSDDDIITEGQSLLSDGEKVNIVK